MMFPFSKWGNKSVGLGEQYECTEKKLLKDEWKKLKEKTQLMEKEQKKLAKEKERLQEEWKELETEKRISRARMKYVERRKSDEDLWMKSEVRCLKRRLDAVEEQLHATRVQKRLKDTDEKQKVEREMEERIRFEEKIRERIRREMT